MPRKSAATEPTEPRRSSRIKNLPKPDLPKKPPPKPRVRKATAKAAAKTSPSGDDGTEGESAPPKTKTKSRTKKRTAEEANGPEEVVENPPAKKTKPASKASAKAGSRAASAKPPSTAAGKKPSSKVGNATAEAPTITVSETIVEENEAEAVVEET